MDYGCPVNDLLIWFVDRHIRRVADDAEYVLYRIVVFKKGADTLKNLCREKRYIFSLKCVRSGVLDEE